MGNFLRRSLAFILGMVFGFVFLATGIVIAGYYAYKNLTLSSVGVTDETIDLGSLNDATIEEWVALVTMASKDPSSYTFADLEENYGLNVDGFLTSMGIDASAVHPDDIKAFKRLSPFMLAEAGGADRFLQSVNLGVVFGFIPKNSDGIYPVFSEGARAKLRSYTIGDLMKTNSNGESKALEILGSIKLGGLISSSFTETFDSATGEYTYAAIDGGFLDSVANLSVNVITSISFDNFDLGYEVNEGAFKDLGNATFGELIGEKGSAAISDSLKDKRFGEIFVKNGDAYQLDVMNVLNALKVGELMGNVYCDGANCSISHSHSQGWYDGSENLISTDDIAGELMVNLYNLTIENLTDGSFDLTSLTSGIYLGKAFGYEIENNSDYCDAGCELDKTNDSHSHKYYWVDGDGKYVGEMNNGLSNISINDVMKGTLSLDGVLGDVLLGELMGNVYCDGANCSISHSHSQGWYDGSGNLISASDVANELMLKLYNLTITDLTNGSFDLTSLTNDIYLGKAFGYKIKNNSGYCEVGCELDKTDDSHSHKYYWVDGDDKYVGALNSALADIEISDVMSGSLNVTDVIGSLYLGEVMGNVYCADGSWKDADGNAINYANLSATDKIVYNLYSIKLSEVMNGNIDLNTAMGDIYVGELMGYSGGVGNWLNDGVKVSSVESVIADVKVSDMLNGTVDFKSKVENIKLGDVVDVSSSNVLKLLADKSISEIPSCVDGLTMGEIVGYEYCDGDNCPISHSHSKGWYERDGETYRKVTGIYGAISDYSIKEISDGRIQNLKIGDVIEVGDNKILQLLSSSTLTSVATDANKIQTGELMGYFYNSSDGKWYSDAEFITQISGLNAKIANYTIEDISNGALSNLINNLTVGDVISNVEDGAFALIYDGALTEGGTSYQGNKKDIPVSELSQRMVKGIQTATYSQLKAAKIDLLSDEDEDAVTAFYSGALCPEDKKPEGGKTWQEVKTLSEVISDIISIVNKTPTLPTT